MKNSLQAVAANRVLNVIVPAMQALRLEIAANNGHNRASFDGTLS
jgi:hypothetical protein